MREPKRQVLNRIQNVFFALGCITIGICALAYFRATVFQNSEQRRFERLLSPATPGKPGPIEMNATIPLRLYATEGEPLGRIEIPRVGLSVIFVEGVKPRDLRSVVGHIPGTAFPDELGNVGIAGHRDTFFRRLKRIQRDDLIVVRTIRGSSQYSVDWTRIVKPGNVEVLEASSEPALTLVTCYPFYYVGPAPERFIVRAHGIGPSTSASVSHNQISDAAARGGQRAMETRTSEITMAGQLP